MSETMNAIHKLSENNKIIREETIVAIRKHREEAESYYVRRLQELCEDPYTEDEDLINDSFFGLFFLAEWKNSSCFQVVQKILKELDQNPDRWMGDLITENFPTLLYQMYDGNLDNLVNVVGDSEMYSFSRIPFLYILFQLNMDGYMSREELIRIIGMIDGLPGDGVGDDYVKTDICYNMARMHYIEYLPRIRELYEKGVIDEILAGDYADYVNIMFQYRNREYDNIRKEYVLERELSHWYEIEGWRDENMDKDVVDVTARMESFFLDDSSFWKTIGRNEPCPCGSGRKFKKCHLPILERQKWETNGIETIEERNRYLRDYPEISFDPDTSENKAGFQREEGRIYLEDYYDRDSICIDYYVYLALRRQPRGVFRFMNDPKETEKREEIQRAYLEKARRLYAEKAQKEGIADPEEFDGKYAIHYMTGEWLGALPRG